MKKKNVKKLSLNKNTITDLEKIYAGGGTGPSPDPVPVDTWNTCGVSACWAFTCNTAVPVC